MEVVGQWTYEGLLLQDHPDRQIVYLPQTSDMGRMRVFYETVDWAREVLIHYKMREEFSQGEEAAAIFLLSREVLNAMNSSSNTERIEAVAKGGFMLMKMLRMDMLVVPYLHPLVLADSAKLMQPADRVVRLGKTINGCQESFARYLLFSYPFAFLVAMAGAEDNAVFFLVEIRTPNAHTCMAELY
jgi:hypothetical protein